MIYAWIMLCYEKQIHGIDMNLLEKILYVYDYVPYVPFGKVFRRCTLTHKGVEVCSKPDYGRVIIDDIILHKVVYFLLVVEQVD